MSFYGNPFDLVRLFNTTGGQVVRDKPVFDIPERRLRYDLVAEEIDETISKGFEVVDFVETMDGLADTVYVAVGAGLTHGALFPIERNPRVAFTLDFTHEDADKESYARRHRTMFSRKLDALLVDLFELSTTEADYLAENEVDRVRALANKWTQIVNLCYVIAASYGVDLDGVIAEVQASNMSKFGPNGEVYRREDGKTMKGPDYFRPNIAKVLREQGFDLPATEENPEPPAA